MFSAYQPSQNSNYFADKPEQGSTSLRSLEYKHVEYLYYINTWHTISDLREGAVAILRNVEKYCPRRIDEDDDLYRSRLLKFAYTPVMSNAIREFTSKLAGAPIHFSSDGGSDKDFWTNFRNNTNGEKQSHRENESALISRIFSSLLYYGRVFVAVDTPEQSFIPRSAYEAEQQGTEPYVVVYEPQYVINWGYNWFITKQLRIDAEPLQIPKTICRWTVWTDVSVKVFEVEVLTGSTSNLNIFKVMNAGQWLSSENALATVPLVHEWVHQLGRCPMTTLTLPTELWTGNSVYTKQLQHTYIESGWTEAGAVAGTIQRIFTPQPPPQMDDPRFTYEQPDYSELSKAGNNHVLIGADYRFVESTGAAIKNLTDQLDTIAKQIKDLVSMQFASVPSSGSGVNTQSGVAKEVDQSMLQDAMKSYGEKVIGLYNDVLTIVAAISAVSEPTVSGLDTYSTDNLGDMVDSSTKLVGLPIPPTAAKIWYGKMSNLMVGSVSPDDEKAITQELEQMLKAGKFDPTDPATAQQPAQLTEQTKPQQPPEKPEKVTQTKDEKPTKTTTKHVDKAGIPSYGGLKKRLQKVYGLSDEDISHVLYG